LPSEAELVKQLQQQLAHTVQQLANREQQLQHAELKIQQLEERLRQQRIAKYGAGSEKLSSLQLEMLEQEPGVSQEEVQAESERPVIAGEVLAVAGYQRKARRSHPGRQSLPADLLKPSAILSVFTFGAGILKFRHVREQSLRHHGLHVFELSEMERYLAAAGFEEFQPEMSGSILTFSASKRAGQPARRE